MDWKSLIAELQKHGYTQPQIASLCGCSQSTVSDLANGHTTEPRYALGAALQGLHDKVKAQTVRHNRRATDRIKAV